MKSRIDNIRLTDFRGPISDPMLAVLWSEYVRLFGFDFRVDRKKKFRDAYGASDFYWKKTMEKNRMFAGQKAKQI
jgi:hypothetical protein